ncbi:hypothetical protein ABIA06_002834 [Bradyrhizobium yuanmingense]|uniref:hypothetical protein n=1 Tax=Bradyrhizobium yuanmingense TaxID=108015 RepID=UPI0035154E79
MIWKNIVSPRVIAPASARWSAKSVFCSKTAVIVSDIASILQNLFLDLRDSYRPELHYMRGPGPKWRAKHQPWPKFASEGVLAVVQHRTGQPQRSGRADALGKSGRSSFEGSLSRESSAIAKRQNVSGCSSAPLKAGFASCSVRVSSGPEAN